MSRDPRPAPAPHRPDPRSESPRPGSRSESPPPGGRPEPDSLPPAESLASRIRARAESLGFDAVGFTRALPTEHPDRFDRWIADGFAGEMEWLARNADRRKDPRLVLPGAKSIVSVAMSYHVAGETARAAARTGESRHAPPAVPEETPPAGAPRGRVARYAWGDDYHDILLDLLNRLRSEIEELSGGKAYVDTGPILEREAAARAGIGWIGKHTLLLRRGTGSWLLLGEILTTAEIEPDEPVPNLCGSCTRCIDACPTGAIVEPYRLDARRCISTLTIETKGSIPEEHRLAMGDWVFGCDICQKVCPWNRKIPLAPRDTFRTRGEATRAPDLIELMNLDDEGFRERFRGSPIRRAKRRGLARNAAVALGNAGDPRAIPALEAARDDPEPLVREHAEWALRRLRDARDSETDEL